MADYAMFHALGQGEQLDPNDPSRTSQPSAAPFNPPIAQHPQHPQLQHPQQPQQQHPQQPQQPHQYGYGTPPPPALQGYGAPLVDNGLAAQLGGMSLGGEPGQPASVSGRKKKKDRHAYHTVEAPAGGNFASAAMSGGVAPTAPGFDSNNGSIGNGVTPAMNQFPAPVGGPFHPAQPTDPAAFAARAAATSGPVPTPTTVPASGQQQVSADDMPSVPLARDSVQPYFLNNVYPTYERHVPPPAAVSFVAFDQGNASPKYARLTMNNIPASAEALAQTGVPLGLVLQPLAPLQPGEVPVPVLDFGDVGPPRCHRCRAYMNPFMVFTAGGNKYVCNLCTYPNDTPPEYFCAVSPSGARTDRDQRPELSRGTVEFVVPKEYWTKEPVGLRWLFVIDVSQESYNRGFLETFCDGILNALYGDEEETKLGLPLGARVGFVTYDREIHFYNVSAQLEQAQMMIMPDIDDPFVPLSEGLFVDARESKAVISSLLARLPQMFSAIKNPEPALLPTLNAAVAALEATGGKIVVGASALPTWGPGRLFMREGVNIASAGDMDKKLYTTDNAPWRKAAERMTAAGIGADFFLAAPSGGYLDIATMGHVAATTGGEVFYYPNFVAPRDGAKLALEVRHTVARDTGYQALIKVRCSNGLQVSAYHGNFVQHTQGGDLDMGVIDEDKALAATFSYDGKLDSKLDAHFQSALLYTTASGERRVRCSNVIASVSESARECLKFVDQDAVVGTLAKEAATMLAATPATPTRTRNWITERTIDVLAMYRKHHAAANVPPAQLVMPERLKEFSMFMLGLLKTRAFKAGSETADRRVHELRMVRAMGAPELSLYLYPRVVPLHNLQPDEGFPDPETGHLRMPPAMRATFARVEPGGVYLVDNGQQCILWLEERVSPNLLADLFGDDKTALKSLDPLAPTLPVLDTHLSAQVRNILEFLRAMRASKGLTVQLARQRLDGAEVEFARLLVEDRNNEAPSYVDWLVHVHKHVQLELGGQRKREDYGDGGLAASFGGLRPSYW